MITHLRVADFLGVKLVDVPIGPLTLFCGSNWSGKSSLQNAIRFALLGEIGRTALLKRDYGLLVREGAKAAEIMLAVDGGEVRCRLTAAGKIAGSGQQGTEIDRLLLDPPRFPALPPTERRRALMALAGPLEPSGIERALQARGADSALTERLLPLLGAGFEAAFDECEGKAKEARSAWKAVTGETYGKDKAEGWAPKAPEPPSGSRQHLAELCDLAAAEVATYRHQDAVTRARVMMLEKDVFCPSCGTKFRIAGDMTEAKQAVDNLQDSLGLLERAMGNRKRDLLAFEQSVAQHEAAMKALDERAKAAAEAHKAVETWTLLRDLCAPDGIPSVLIEPVLERINARLAAASVATGWSAVQVRPDMEILRGGRPYGLCSEAERWTAEAMLADALQHVAGGGTVMLDRADVLDLEHRSELVEWCVERAAEGKQTILFATLKAKPESADVVAYWMRRGEVGA